MPVMVTRLFNLILLGAMAAMARRRADLVVLTEMVLAVCRRAW